jgi:hypothetical protein
MDSEKVELFMLGAVAFLSVVAAFAHSFLS